MDVKMLTYIQSEYEFGRANQRAFWERVRGLVTRRDVSLLCFNEVVARLQPAGVVVDRGLQDIPVDKITGSAGRTKDFTRHFLPRLADMSSKERWRNIYTLAVTGAGFPPIEVYKLGDTYFVQDGHHRVSVANHLNWKTIQAYVTELSLPAAGEAEFYNWFDHDSGLEFHN